MSYPTIAEVRQMVDDLDEKVRDVIVKGDIEAVFAKERASLVSKWYIYGL